MTASSTYQNIHASLDEKSKGSFVEIQSKTYWFKVVEFLQTNWALIDEHPNGRAQVWFVNDLSGVFDSIVFNSLSEAVDGLVDNGFELLSESPSASKFLAPPEKPFKYEPHPNGRIYSDSRFWV
jgi:hypothetical protein